MRPNPNQLVTVIVSLSRGANSAPLRVTRVKLWVQVHSTASRKAGRKRKALLELLDQVENIVQTGQRPGSTSPASAAPDGSPVALPGGEGAADQDAERSVCTRWVVCRGPL